jgi:hypothetical protein
VHSAQHASDELVDAIALLDQGNQRSNAALVVCAAAEVREDQLLEGVDLVLQGHQVGDGLVSLVGVVDGLETDVLLILERSCPCQPENVCEPPAAVPLNSGCCRWKASLAIR